jgi:hypothetical protein
VLSQKNTMHRLPLAWRVGLILIAGLSVVVSLCREAARLERSEDTQERSGHHAPRSSSQKGSPFNGFHPDTIAPGAGDELLHGSATQSHPPRQLSEEMLNGSHAQRPPDAGIVAPHATHPDAGSQGISSAPQSAVPQPTMKISPSPSLPEAIPGVQGGEYGVGAPVMSSRGLGLSETSLANPDGVIVSGPHEAGSGTAQITGPTEDDLYRIQYGWQAYGEMIRQRLVNQANGEPSP